MMHRTARLWAAAALCAAPIVACATGQVVVEGIPDAGSADVGQPPPKNDGGPLPDGGCASPTVKCGSACVDTKTDGKHCGGCNMPCAMSEACENGTCHLACSSPTVRCDVPPSSPDAGDGGGSTGDGGTVEQCIDTKKDDLHCGGCNKPCAQGYACDAGACDLVCTGGLTKCNTVDAGAQCKNTVTDGEHCGMCNKACTGGQVCINSVCQNAPVTNIGPQATATSSGGGSGTYGPTAANNGTKQATSCTYFCWVTAGGAPGTAWLQYTWSQTRTVVSINVDTNSTGTDSCGNSGRVLAGAQVQYWNGSAWVTDGTVSAQTNDWSYTFTQPRQTTQIRLYGMYATGGQATNPIVFELEAMGY
jgi:hypothetical protein